MPPPAAPAANYVPYQRLGNTIFLSGHLPFIAPNYNNMDFLMKGRLGENVTTQEGFLW